MIATGMKPISSLSSTKLLRKVFRECQINNVTLLVNTSLEYESLAISALQGLGIDQTGLDID